MNSSSDSVTKYQRRTNGDNNKNHRSMSSPSEVQSYLTKIQIKSSSCVNNSILTPFLLLGPFLMGMLIGEPSTNFMIFAPNSPRLYYLSVLFPLFGVVGAIISALLTNTYGRKFTTITFGSILISGECIKICSIYGGVTTYYIARCFNGFAASSLIVSTTVWLFDILPPTRLKYYKPTIQIFINLGISVISFLSSKIIIADRWYIPSYLVILVSSILVIISCIMPESYKYIYVQTSNNYLTNQALLSLRQREDIDQELHDTINIINTQRDSNKTSFIEFIKNRKCLASVSSWCLLNFFKQISGINVLVAFTHNLLVLSYNDVKEDYSSLIISLIGLFASIFSYPLLIRYPRKLLILVSFTTITILMAILMICFVWNAQRSFILAIFSFVMISFQIGIGPITWFICAEIFPIKYLDVAQGLTSSFGWMGDSLVFLMFPILQKYMGIRQFYILVVVNLVCVIFVILFIGETLNLPIEKIQQSYLQRWQHVCFGLHIPIHVTHFEIN